MDIEKMEFEDEVDYATVGSAQESLVQQRKLPAQPPPSTHNGPRSIPVRSHPAGSERLKFRNPRDALPPLPPNDPGCMTYKAPSMHGVPSQGTTVRTQMFPKQDMPPKVPQRKARQSSEENRSTLPRQISSFPNLATSLKVSPAPKPKPPAMAPPTSPRNLIISSPTDHAMSGNVDVPDSITSSLADPADDVEPISLAQFVKRYSNSLPLRIRVDKGFCDQDEQGGISSGDVYTIHFLKRTKMVTIADMSGYTYKIPLNSAVKFALLYDPDQDFNKASRGYTFEKAGNIIALKSKLPQVVRALRAHNTNDPKSSVEEKELFVVKGVNRGTIKRKLTLKVYSVTNEEEKVLTEDCMGKFTTASSYIPMYVADILEFIPDQLPLKVAVCLDDDSDDILPAGLITDAATIQSMDIKTSLIATPCWEGQDEDVEECVPVEISIGLDIDVTILEDDDEIDYEDTRKLLEEFDPSRVQIYDSPGEELYCAIREGHETLGTEIQRPQMLLNTMQQHTSSIENSSPPPLPPHNSLPRKYLAHPPLPPTKTSATSLKHPTLSPITPKPPLQKHKTTELTLPPLLHPKDNTIPPSIKPRPSSGKAASITPLTLGQGLPSDLLRDVSSLSAEVKKIMSHVSSLDQQVAILQEKVRKLSGTTHQENSSSPYNISQSDSAGVEEMNRKRLTKMTHMEIMKLLEAMNLTQYQRMFMKEQVDGEVLAQCSDDALERELKVTSTLHRTRLMKLITGRYSAQSILDGEDPYVDMIK